MALSIRTVGNVRSEQIGESVVTSNLKTQGQGLLERRYYSMSQLERYVNTLMCDKRNVSQHMYFYSLTIGDDDGLLFGVYKVLALFIESFILCCSTLHTNEWGGTHFQ